MARAAVGMGVEVEEGVEDAKEYSFDYPPTVGMGVEVEEGVEEKCSAT